MSYEDKQASNRLKCPQLTEIGKVRDKWQLMAVRTSTMTMLRSQAQPAILRIGP